MDSYPKFRVAAVQAEPMVLDREATVAKACQLIEEAGKNGAKVIALPEGFIPGHPEWFFFHPAYEAMARFHRQFFKNSVEVPSSSTKALGEAARRAGAYVAVGINERVPGSMGSLHNSLLFLNPQGNVMGVHRKIMPTTTERLVHASGDGSSLRVYETEYGGLGGLLCGENTNSLARFALLAQGEKIHTAHWPSFPTKYQRAGAEGVDIRIRYHAYEGKIFVISSSAVFGEASLEKICTTEESRKMAELGAGFSAVVDPYGRYIGGPLKSGEGIVYADVDLEQMIDAKTLHDVVGHYNRFDVLSLLYRRKTPRPIIFLDEDESEEKSATAELASHIRTLLTKLESKDEVKNAASKEISQLEEMLAALSPVPPDAGDESRHSG